MYLMPTAALELKYLKMLKTNVRHGNNTGHTIMMMHMRAKYQVIHVPRGTACGVKSITGMNNYSNRELTGVNRSLPPIETTLE